MKLGLFPRLALPGALFAVFGVPVYAQVSPPAEPIDRVHGADHAHDQLEEVIVTATPLQRDAAEMSQSTTVLHGEALQREIANNIGDTLSGLPGVTNASFGQNIGRPVIRGLQGARVGVLSNNMTATDASVLSQDHAVSVEPFLADQIEVLRGPSTLLYGSGAIGGVVNIVSHTIPQEVPEGGFAGRAMIQGDNAADQRFAAARIDIGAGSFAVHADAFVRRTDDYEIPGEAELFGADHDDDHDDEHDDESGDAHAGILENSFLDNEGGAIGAAWIGDRWRVGLAWTRYDSDYGIPGAHGHGHGDDDEDDHDDGHEDDDHDDRDHEEEEFVTIGLKSRRVEAELVGNRPFSGMEQLKFRFADTDYEHTEFEGDDIGTVFRTDSQEARLELRHLPVGRATGAFGLQYTDRDLSALGEEAFIPPSNTQSAAVFLVESLDFDGWQLDFGLRYEDVDVQRFERPDEHDDEEEHDDEGHEHDLDLPGPDRRGFKPFSASIGAIWHITEGSHLNFNFSRSERAPLDQELYSNGPHFATQSFEIGNPFLDMESSLHLEGGYRIHHGRLTGSVVFYTEKFDKFIYQANTGEEADDLPVRQWRQQDADFNGAELEWRYDLGDWASGHWLITGFADIVRGKLEDDTRVPRMPPVRIGLGVEWDWRAWSGSVNWIHASSQTKLAELETHTPGYDLLNAELSWSMVSTERFDLTLYLKGRNLLDEDIRNSTSFLKDEAPQIGRNFILGLRASF